MSEEQTQTQTEEYVWVKGELPETVEENQVLVYTGSLKKPENNPFEIKE